MALVVKNPSTNAGDLRDVGSIPGSGRSPGEGHSNPLQWKPGSSNSVFLLKIAFAIQSFVFP